MEVLMFGALCGDATAMEVLLAQSGVDVDEQDLDGCSPIMAAAKMGNVEAFRASYSLAPTSQARWPLD